MRNALLALVLAAAILAAVMYLRGGQTYRVKPGHQGPVPDEHGKPTPAPRPPGG